MSTRATSVPLLLSVAIADAYGAGFEFEAPAVVARENDGRHYRKRDGFTPGHYTDDTQMSLALAELVLCGEPWEPRYLADRFVTVYHRDPRPGYARGFESVLQTCRNGRDFLHKIRPDSERNGAAMRALPIGVLPAATAAQRAARIQARLTHDTPAGIDSARAVALMAHYGLYQLGPLERLPAYLERSVPGHPWTTPWQGPVPLHGIATVRAALTALVSCRRQSHLLRTAVAFTGDTDSVAAIAVGAAACYREYRRDLPAALHRGLEKEDYGRGYLQSLDRRLGEGVCRATRE